MNLFGIPGRIILPSVTNDGAAVGIENHILGESGELRIKRPDVWRDGQRPPISITARDKILDAILSSDSLVQDPQQFNEYVSSLYSFVPLNPWKGVAQLKTSLTPEAQQLFDADLGLLRPCSGEAHANAVRNLLETNYAEYLRHSPTALATARLYTELQDAFKPLSIAITGDSFSQSRFNPIGNDNILQALTGRDAEVMKQAIGLLSRNEMIGDLLQAKPEEFEETLQRLKDGPLAAMRAAWPTAIGVSADDMLLIAYLCDAGAHTRFAEQPDELSKDFAVKWAVTPEDAQLTKVFEQREDDLLLLQAEPRRRAALLLTEATATRDLLMSDSEESSIHSHAATFKTVIQDFFDRLRSQGSEQLIIDETEFSTIKGAVAASGQWSWVENFTLQEAPKTPPAKPSKIPGAHVTLRGREGEELRQEIYYVRGGKIWRQEQRINLSKSGATIDRLQLLNALHERDEHYRNSGPEAAAEADVYLHFGVPLNDAEAEELLVLLQR